VPALGIPAAYGVQEPKWLLVTVGIVGVVFTYLGITHAAYKAEGAIPNPMKTLGNQAGDGKLGVIVGIAGAAVVAVTTIASINGGSIDAVAVPKADFVDAKTLTVDNLKVGGVAADSVEGVPVAVACDHIIMSYTTKDSSYLGKTAGGNDTTFIVKVRIDSTVAGQFISRPEFKSGHEFQPGNMIVYRVFEVDADGNEALVNVYKYPLSPRTDGQIYVVSDYPIINPNPPAKQ
jgi:hypothetical protein